MKKEIIFLLTTIILFACDKKNSETNEIKPIQNLEQTSLVGSWKLTETLLDPGDGSGVFMPVVSEKTIQFNEDSTVTSNGSLCSPTGETDNASYGTYSSVDSIINSASCSEGILNLQYTLSDSTLIVTHLCFEPCKAKFVKVD